MKPEVSIWNPVKLRLCEKMSSIIEPQSGVGTKDYWSLDLDQKDHLVVIWSKSKNKDQMKNKSLDPRNKIWPKIKKPNDLDHLPTPGLN